MPAREHNDGRRVADASEGRKAGAGPRECRRDERTQSGRPRRSRCYGFRNRLASRSWRSATNVRVSRSRRAAWSGRFFAGCAANAQQPGSRVTVAAPTSKLAKGPPRQGKEVGTTSRCTPRLSQCGLSDSEQRLFLITPMRDERRFAFRKTREWATITLSPGTGFTYRSRRDGSARVTYARRFACTNIRMERWRFSVAHTACPTIGRLAL